MTTDTNKIFIVKLSNDNWAVLTRHRESAERSLSYWKIRDKGARMVTATLTEDESPQDFADNLDLSTGADDWVK